MKKFEEPILKLDVLEVEDVVTTSSCSSHSNCDFDGGEFSLR